MKRRVNRVFLAVLMCAFTYHSTAIANPLPPIPSLPNYAPPQTNTSSSASVATPTGAPQPNPTLTPTPIAAPIPTPTPTVPPIPTHAISQHASPGFLKMDFMIANTKPNGKPWDIDLPILSKPDIAIRIVANGTILEEKCLPNRYSCSLTFNLLPEAFVITVIDKDISFDDPIGIASCDSSISSSCDIIDYSTGVPICSGTIRFSSDKDLSEKVRHARLIACKLRVEYPEWKDRLPVCPCLESDMGANQYRQPHPVFRQSSPVEASFESAYHPGAKAFFRQIEGTVVDYISPSRSGSIRPAQQCTYAGNKLITSGQAAGTPDAFSPETTLPLQGSWIGRQFTNDSHTIWDVQPAEALSWTEYNETWTPSPSTCDPQIL